MGSPDTMTGAIPNTPPQPVAHLPGERESFIQTTDGLRLRMREWGDERAPAIVLLHGLRGYSGTWRGLASILAQDWHLIAIDHRGRGQSEWDPECNYYTDAYLADLEAAVSACNLGRFVLLGHSMGGTTAYCYAAKNPDRLDALIIEDIAPGSSVSGDGAARIKREMADMPHDFADWAEARTYWRRTRPTVGEAALEERLCESLREGGDGRISWRYDSIGISRTRLDPDPARVVDLWPVVEGIRTPALVIRGGRSDFCRLDTVEEMVRRNPRFAHATVPEASHYVHDDAPVLFQGLVEGFLAGVAATRHAIACG